MKKKVYLLSLILLIIDVVTKLIVKNNMELYQSVAIIPNFFNLTYVINTGAAFSILENQKIFLILLGVIVLIFLMYSLNKEAIGNFKMVYYSLLLSGIVGNLIDRIVYNGVVDFLDFKIFKFDAPIFNLADTFICIGVFLIIIRSIKGELYANRG